MLIELALNDKKVEQYNQYVRDFNRGNPTVCLKEVKKLEDRFRPYVQMISDPVWRNYQVVARDHRPNVELHGVYVCGANDHYVLKYLTDYKAVTNYDSPLYWWDYGVADNASQVLDYYDHLYEKYCDYMNNRNFVILMSPIFRKDQPKCGGWRWHKWGEYIGDFDHKCEYLYDEQGIDYVWVFKIVELEQCTEEG